MAQLDNEGILDFCMEGGDYKIDVLFLDWGDGKNPGRYENNGLKSLSSCREIR